MIRIILGFVVLMSATLAFAAPVIIPVQADHGKVEFHAVGRPSMIKINGEGKGPAGQLTVNGSKVEGDLTFDMTSLTSGISMRDSHMKERYLEVQKFPEAKLHLTEVSLPAGWSFAKSELKDRPFKGDLTLHGVTKPVTGTFDVKPGTGGMASATARFVAQIDQHGVEIPKYLGITVKNEVPIELQMNDLKATK